MYLLDTNALINLFCCPQKLSKKVREILINERKLFVSIVSLWEISIKQSIGKLNISASITELAALCEQRNIQIIEIKAEELEKIKELEKIHNDPFDRLLIAQGILNDLTIITCDEKFSMYEELSVLRY